MALTWFPVISIGGGETVFSVQYDPDVIEGYTPIDEDNPVALPYYKVTRIAFLNTGADTWFATYDQLRGQAGSKHFEQLVTPGMDLVQNIPPPLRPMTYETEYGVNLIR